MQYQAAKSFVFWISSNKVPVLPSMSKLQLSWIYLGIQALLLLHRLCYDCSRVPLNLLQFAGNKCPLWHASHQFHKDFSYSNIRVGGKEGEGGEEEAPYSYSCTSEWERMWHFYHQFVDIQLSRREAKTKISNVKWGQIHWRLGELFAYNSSSQWVRNGLSLNGLSVS